LSIGPETPTLKFSPAASPVPHAPANTVFLEQLKSEFKDLGRFGKHIITAPRGIGIPIVPNLGGVIEGRRFPLDSVVSKGQSVFL